MNKYFVNFNQLCISDKENDVLVGTSHMDAIFDRNFVSCNTGKPITQDMWIGANPDNSGYSEACAIIAVNTDSPDRLAFGDINCANINHPLLCEVYYIKQKFKSSILFNFFIVTV
jgi:hypothetical protein